MTSDLLPRRLMPILVAGISTILIAASTTFGRPAPESATPAIQDLRPNVPPDFNARQKGLDPNPLIVEAIGLAMHPPATSQATISRIEGATFVSINDVSARPSWGMTVQLLAPTGDAITPQAQVDQHLAQLALNGRPHRVILNEATRYGGVDGRLFYVEESAPGVEPHITGFLILPMGDSLMLVFSILAIPAELPSLQATFRNSFETIRLRSAAELSLQRRSRIDAGRDFLASITPDRLRQLVGIELWTRLYRTGATPRDEAEIGYSRLDVQVAKRGALNPERAEKDYTPSENVEGLMVRIQGRVIGDLAGGIFYDTIAMYWIAWDQSEEAWTVRGTQRQGLAQRSEAETGARLPARDGEPIPSLTVIHSSQNIMDGERSEWAVPEVYLSQALSPLLGRLLPRDLREPREYAYYYYHSSDRTPQLSQRIDRWAPESSGNWSLTTRFSVEAAPITSLYSSSGQLIRTTRVDGTITEPITPDALRRLWERKGLPITDRDDRQRGRQPR